MTGWRFRINRWRLRFLRWQNDHLPGGVVLILIALVLGIFTGMAAAMLKRLVSLLNRLVLAGAEPGKPFWWLLLWPLVGIFLTFLFQKYIVRGNVARGTTIIKRHLNMRKYLMSPLTIFNSLIGCALTMGMGASAGTEGPAALSGSAIATNIGRFLRLPPEWIRLLLGIGGGAGIAAIFKSPIGGVLFALEVLQVEMKTMSVLALVIACLFSSSTAFLLSDFTFDILFTRSMPVSPSSLGWVALLGLFCGLYSIYYNYTKNRSQKMFMAVRDPRLGALLTGGVTSLFVFLFPALLGEGFGVITSLVNGETFGFGEYGLFAGHTGPVAVGLIIIAILLVKGMLVAASYSNGGVAGDFVPTFFAGALAGYLFGLVCNHFFGAGLPGWYFALIGMGCVMAGTIHAPLMAIFILCETTNTFLYIFPYLIAVAVSYATVKIITPRSWYSGTGHDDILALLDGGNAPSIRSRLSGKN